MRSSCCARSSLYRSAHAAILAAPNSTDRAQWVLRDDSPHLFADVADAVAGAHPVGNRKETVVRPDPDHTHDYYGRASDINRDVWAFLRAHRLGQDPRFKPYDMR